MFTGFDHIAIVGEDTDRALSVYRDKLGLPVAFSEIMEDQGVRLTHLEMGGCHLQLVQPLVEEHPLKEYLQEYGEGLHHLCFKVQNVPETIVYLPEIGLASRDKAPRSGPLGKQAAFIDPATTQGVLIEITGEPSTGE
jgi:methylmalonyl-CoA/ethylmalonyl-CoA epimerase